MRAGGERESAEHNLQLLQSPAFHVHVETNLHHPPHTILSCSCTTPLSLSPHSTSATAPGALPWFCIQPTDLPHLHDCLLAVDIHKLVRGFANHLQGTHWRHQNLRSPVRDSVTLLPSRAVRHFHLLLRWEVAEKIHLRSPIHLAHLDLKAAQQSGFSLARHGITDWARGKNHKSSKTETNPGKPCLQFRFAFLEVNISKGLLSAHERRHQTQISGWYRQALQGARFRALSGLLPAEHQWKYGCVSQNSEEESRRRDLLMEVLMNPESTPPRLPASSSRPTSLAFHSRKKKSLQL